MALYEAVLRIQENPDISECDVVYHAEAPFSTPIVLFLRKEGIRLEFDGVSQLLVKIEATDMNAVKFTYRGFIHF